MATEFYLNAATGAYLFLVNISNHAAPFWINLSVLIDLSTPNIHLTLSGSKVRFHVALLASYLASSRDDIEGTSSCRSTRYTLLRQMVQMDKIWHQHRKYYPGSGAPINHWRGHVL